MTRLARRAAGLSLLATLLLSVMAPPSSTQERLVRYSGRVERVDLGDGVVVVDELGARGRHQRHEVHVGAETAIVSTGRVRPWQMRGARAYEEVPVTLADLLSGDFVVVETMVEDGRTIALRITIVEDPRRSR